MELSQDFRKANTEPSVHFRRANTETYQKQNVYLSKRVGMNRVFFGLAEPLIRIFCRALPSGNPSEQLCQPSENPVLPSSFTQTRRYGPLCGPTSSSCGGLRPRLFFALRAKKELFMLFWPIFRNFWCPVVTMVTFRRNLINFEGKQKKHKNIKE